MLPRFWTPLRYGQPTCVYAPVQLAGILLLLGAAAAGEPDPFEDLDKPPPQSGDPFQDLEPKSKPGEMKTSKPIEDKGLVPQIHA